MGDSVLCHRCYRTGTAVLHEIACDVTPCPDCSWWAGLWLGVMLGMVTGALLLSLVALTLSRMQ